MPTQSLVPARQLTHLRPGEVELFRRFEQLAPIGDALFEFDVHLGRGLPIDPTWPAWLISMATTLTQKRVDLVAHTNAATWILEIKPRAGPGAVGQLLTYRQLYLEQLKPTHPLHLGIIADRNSYDMLPVYDAHAIRLFLV